MNTPALVSVGSMNVSILRGKFMTLKAVRFSRIYARARIASEQIFSTSYDLKMIGVHTRSFSAQMINLKSFFNWAFKKHVRNAMSVVRFFSKTNYSIISIFTTGFGPKPVPAIFRFSNFSSEPFINCFHENAYTPVTGGCQ